MTNELLRVVKAYRHLEKNYLSMDKDTDEFLAAVSMFESMSYRLLGDASKDRLIGFRLLFNIIKYKLGRHDKSIICDVNTDSKTIIISGELKKRDEIINYIERVSGKKIKSYLEKDSICTSNLMSWSQLVFYLPFSLKQAFRCVFNWRRTNIALTIYEILEISVVLKYVKDNGIEHVYDFLPYEKDRNFLALLLMEDGVKVTKNPSPGPLAKHNRILIADEVTLSTPYQIEEFLAFKDTIRVKQYLYWPLEGAFDYVDKYLNYLPTPKHTIGFYSHGQWLRNVQGHANSGGANHRGEPELLDWIKQFLDEKPQFKLIVFPHPREKTPDHIKAMKEYYHAALGDIDYEIITENVKTMHALEKVDIAVVQYSTVIYERLFCGYKTLIGNKFIKGFPMNSSPLNNICFQSYQEMKCQIEKYIDKDEDYFFTETGLEKYRFINNPELHPILTNA